MWNDILKIGPSPTKNQGKPVLSSQQLAVVYKLFFGITVEDKEGIKQLHGITHGVSIPDW
ncbi:unnamed protein product [Brassica oleracea var. botrytis]